MSGERPLPGGTGGVYLMVTVLRTVDDVLAWAGLLVEPPLRTAVGRLPAPSRDIAELQLGWRDEDPPTGPQLPAGGLRPALALVCAGAAGGDPHDAVPGAVAVELVHHWSLIQRDLFDGDLTRRHRPTAWSVAGAHPATLGGEALLALAFDVAATGDPTRTVPGPFRQATRDTRAHVPAERGRPATIDPAADGAGDMPDSSGWSAGPADRDLDLHLDRGIGPADRGAGPADRGRGANDGRWSDGSRRPSSADQVDRISIRILGDTVQQVLQSQHIALGTTSASGTAAAGTWRPGSDLLRECLAAVEQRSGALLGCACALGALAGGGDRARVEQLRLFGVRLGLAVQFAEDLLGVWGDPAVTGRPTYPDLRRRRRSLPVTAALAAGADELADLLHRDARLSDTDLERAAKVIEQSGARSWCLQQAEDLLAQALLALDLAIPEPAAVAELVALARWATRHPT